MKYKQFFGQISMYLEWFAASYQIMELQNFEFKVQKNSSRLLFYHTFILGIVTLCSFFEMIASLRITHIFTNALGMNLSNREMMQLITADLASMAIDLHPASIRAYIKRLLILLHTLMYLSFYCSLLGKFKFLVFLLFIPAISYLVMPHNLMVLTSIITTDLLIQVCSFLLLLITVTTILIMGFKGIQGTILFMFILMKIHGHA